MPSPDHCSVRRDARVSQTSRLTVRVELTATRMVAGGDALGRIDDGRVALIDGALPGERVRIEVTANKADLVRGRVVEVLEASAGARRAAVRARAGRLRRLRLAARRRRNAAATQARHHPRRTQPHRAHHRRAARGTGPAADRGLPHDGARARRRRQARVPQAPVARPGDDRLVPGRAPRDRRAPARGQVRPRHRGDVARRRRYRRAGRAGRTGGDRSWISRPM